MSTNPLTSDLDPRDVGVDAIESTIIPRVRDLGGFNVRRVLPAAGHGMVGPFIFFDQMGPAEMITGQGIDVRPHPHIGLATVTYLYEGEFQHHDSLGTDQMIYPGEVNWMVAGEGITHSERTSEETRAGIHTMSGIQTWVALPKSHEDAAPSFHHHGKPELPHLQDAGVQARVILGDAFGARSPVPVFSDMFYVDMIIEAGRSAPIPSGHEDRAAYVVHGKIRVAGQDYEAGQMLIFREGDEIAVQAGPLGARLMLLGGDVLDGPRYLWWNFVASSKERLEHARRSWAEGDWEGGQFSLPPGDDSEFIPIPEEPEAVMRAARNQNPKKIG